MPTFSKPIFTKQYWTNVWCQIPSNLQVHVAQFWVQAALHPKTPKTKIPHLSSHKSWRKDKVLSRPTSNKQCLSTPTKHVLERQSNKKVACSVWSRGPSSARQQGSPNRTKGLSQAIETSKTRLGDYSRMCLEIRTLTGLRKPFAEKGRCTKQDFWS